LFEHALARIRGIAQRRHTFLRLPERNGEKEKKAADHAHGTKVEATQVIILSGLSCQ
jgi:hypothetical protein